MAKNKKKALENNNEFNEQFQKTKSERGDGIPRRTDEENRRGGEKEGLEGQNILYGTRGLWYWTTITVTIRSSCWSG